MSGAHRMRMMDWHNACWELLKAGLDRMPPPPEEGDDDDDQDDDDE